MMEMSGNEHIPVGIMTEISGNEHIPVGIMMEMLGICIVIKNIGELTRGIL
jgi:hypothetical protein